MSTATSLNLKFVSGFRPANVQLIRDINERNKLVAYESEWQGKRKFDVRQIFTRDGGETWEPGKGLQVPIDEKQAFLAALARFALNNINDKAESDKIVGEAA